MSNSSFLLNAIEIQGYKGFANNARITLSDLTLIYGENSAGKSSAMRLLVSIARAVRKKSKYPLLPIEIDGQDKNFSSLFTNSHSIPLNIALEFCDLQSCAVLKLRFSIQYVREQNTALISDFSITDGEDEWIYEVDTDYVTSELLERKYFLRHNQVQVDADLRFEFYGLAPKVFYSHGCTDGFYAKLATCIEKAYNGLSVFAQSVIWIGPLRYLPPRHSTLSCFPADFSPDGREALQLLHPANPKGIEIAAKCSAWFEDATSRVLSVGASVESNVEVFTVFLAPKEAPAMQIPISEHGAGMAQALPIVVLCAAASLGHLVFKVPPLLIFENPELHLHDAVHEKLADLFLEIAGQDGIRILAETHSENVLLTMQIAELQRSEQDAKTISVNWVRKNEQGYSEIAQFRFDENGSLGGLWSRSIFSYTPELVRRVMAAKMKKKAGGADAN